MDFCIQFLIQESENYAPMDIIVTVNLIQRPAFLTYSGNYILYMLCPRATINLSTVATLWHIGM